MFSQVNNIIIQYLLNIFHHSKEFINFFIAHLVELAVLAGITPLVSLFNSSSLANLNLELAGS